MIVSPYYQNGVIVFSERYERPDPISLPSERTHGDWGMLLTNPMENPSLALQLLLYPLSLLLTLLLFPYTLLLILRLFMRLPCAFYRVFISVPRDFRLRPYK